MSGMKLLLNIRQCGLLLTLVALAMLSSCTSSRFLTTNQMLLEKTKIVFKNEKDVKDKSTLLKELEPFITLEPNNKILFFIPREYLYLANADTTQNHWYNKALRNLGEKPVLYDEEKAKTIVSNMENYLRYKKGYYDARVDFLVNEVQHGLTTSRGLEIWDEAQLTFLVATGDRYRIREITYESLDKAVLQFIEDHQENAIIKKGDYIDYNKFELEKSRLTVELQNSGYINFSNYYFEISGDSSQTKKDVNIFIHVRVPLPDSTHTRFRTGEVQVFTDHYNNQPMSVLSVDTLNGVQFYRQSKKFLVKKELINDNIFFKEGRLLSREDRQKTFKKLNGLGTYRFVTINSFQDKERDSIMNFNVLLTPYPKKWIWDGGLQGYFSTLGAARLFGFSVSSQFVNRNLLGGSERYTLRAEIGTELGYGKETGFVKRTTNISVQNNLTIPTFRDFIGLGHFANKVGIIKTKFFNSFKEDANTNIALGYSDNNIIDLYGITSFNASYGFDYVSPKNNRYVYRPLGFNLDLYKIIDEGRFAALPLVRLSFKDNLGTGFLFRDLTYIYNSQKDKRGNSFLLINNLELSGWEVHLANKIYNFIAREDKVWTLDKLAFAKYARYELDARYNKEISATQSFAARFNAGIISGFGESLSVPFVRQFGVGGPNSLRAWNLKEPGPGAYRDPHDKIETPLSVYTNQGDIKLEMNAEYRFNIFYFVDGAIFADAGNVWLLRPDEARPNAEISKHFFNQIAVGAGYGIRFNFNFFVIRFDFGYKLRNPYKDEFTGRSWYNFREIRQQGLGNVQVAVNYPF